jgi:broad-specificity NMP kinase
MEKKIIITGAPGTGKTSVDSFFPNVNRNFFHTFIKNYKY